MEQINGIIVIDKETGFTSHDVVAKTRKILSQKKIGHTGTLDPDATGVLPICLGTGTKVSDMLTMSDKEYITTVKLGIVTDTQDISGKVIETRTVENFTPEVLKEAISHFIGEIFQIPPMYSAVKIGGQKMCDLARKGIEVEREPRKITIYSIDVLSVGEDEFSLKVSCSKGTYIRTLCHDIGQYLGCGACITSLRRTKSSVFSLDDAITLSQLEELVSKGDVSSVIKCVDSVFLSYPQFVANDEIQFRLKNGAPSTVPVPLGKYRVYDEDNNFIAIGEVERINGRNKISVVKYFA